MMVRPFLEERLLGYGAEPHAKLSFVLLEVLCSVIRVLMFMSLL